MNLVSQIKTNETYYKRRWFVALLVLSFLLTHCGYLSEFTEIAILQSGTTPSETVLRDYLIVSDVANDTLAFMKIGSSGALTTGPSISLGATDPIQIGANATHKFIVVPTYSGQKISVVVDSGTTSLNLALTAGSPKARPVGAGAPQMAIISSNGEHAYIVYEDGKVTQYSVNSTTRELTEGTTTTLTGVGGSAYYFVSDSTQTRFYIGSYGTGKVAALTRNATTGALTEVAGSAFAAVGSVLNMAMKNSDDFLYAVSNGSGVKVLAVQANGSLTDPGLPVLQVGQTLTGIAITPDDRFAYTVNSAAQITGYSINQTTGALTILAGFPMATVADSHSPVITSDGNYLYIGSSSLASIDGYSINTSTGALTQISGAPFASPGASYGMIQPR